MDTHPDMMAASQEAVSAGRITPEQANYLMAFLANPGAFSLSNILGIIIPILGLIFPQFASLFALIAPFFGGLTPTPPPTPPNPNPAPVPNNPFAQIWALIQSILAGGKLPVPKPAPPPVPPVNGDIIVPTPSP